MRNVNIRIVNRNNIKFRKKSIFCRISGDNSFLFFFLNFFENKLYIKYNYVLYCVDLFDNFILLNEQLYIDNIIFLCSNFNGGGSKNNYFLLNSNSSFIIKNNINLV